MMIVILLYIVKSKQCTCTYQMLLCITDVQNNFLYFIFICILFQCPGDTLCCVFRELFLYKFIYLQMHTCSRTDFIESDLKEAMLEALSSHLDWVEKTYRDFTCHYKRLLIVRKEKKNAQMELTGGKVI